jgi:hypothetical protein
MTTDLDKYVVLKLISGEELIGQLVKEDDYALDLQFPMIVRHINRSVGGFPAESLILSTYSHFCADDQFTFNKQHIIVMKDLDPRYVDEYHHSVDDFINQSTSPQAQNPEELKDLSEKLKSLFKDRLSEEEDYPEMISLNHDGIKIIH